MPNVGYATLQIIPSVRGIGNELRRQLVAPAGNAGGAAGQESGSRFSDAWKAGLAAAGAVAGAVLVSATVSAVEKERMSDRLSAQLGLSGKGAQQAGKVAGGLYSNAVVATFEDGAAAVRSVMASGLIPEKATTKSIEAITTKVADLASTFDQDLAGTANAAAQMIRTGLAKDGAQALDLLTTGFQSSANKADDLVDTINEYGVQFKKAGLDGATSIGLLNQAIGAGARDADVAADAIKEFSIRAVDGSKTSADGFKALGLNADVMGQKFAQGGSAANGVLDLTLDKLRGIKDPVQQSQAAVALFGTQAEDLGASLLAMDPSTAAAGLDKVGGAAKRVGDTIRGNTSTELTVLQRKFTGALGSAVTAVVLPGLRGLITALGWVGDAVAATGAWFQKWGAWLIPVGILVAGLTLLLNANAIATAAVTAVFSVYRGAILAWAAVQRTAIAVQVAWNAVMALNPIGLIIIGLVALGAALVVAYQKSETFRNIVQGAWSVIKTGWQAMWTFLKPGVDAFMVGLRAIGDAATWLWGVLGPVFNFIWQAIKIVATIYAVLLIGPWILGFKLIGAVATWLWETVLSPVFQAIGDAALWLWNSAIKPAWDGIMAGIRAVGAIASWLWTSVFRPVLTWIGDKAAWLWSQKIKPAWDFIKVGIGLVGDKIKELWNTYARPIFTFIADKATWLWDKALKPAFDAGKKGVAALGDSFGKAKDMIKTAWDKLEGIAKKPIGFIINTVYNGGIVPVWNKVAGAFGAPKLDKVKGFATGGRVFGAGTETSDDVPAWLSHNEHVWTAAEVRGAGGHGAVASMRKWAAAGGGSAGTPGFAKGGGLWDWVKGTASKGVDLAASGVSWLKDGVKASAQAGLNSIVKPLIEKISGSASLYRDMVKGIPKKMLSSIFDYSGKADSKLEKAGIGGKGYKAGLSWARTQAGKRYQWAGNGDPSWDCSGLVSAIESVIRGQKPHRRWATGSFSGTTAPPGWVLGARSPYMIGITNAGVGHTAGTINGVNVESRGGDGVVVGQRARSYRDGLFTHRYGLKYDAGGWLMPGATMAVNKTGSPEAVLTAPQWEAVAAQAAAAKAAATSRPVAAGTADRSASLEGLSVAVFVGSEEISRLARAEVHAANGELIAVLNAGGGNT